MKIRNGFVSNSSSSSFIVSEKYFKTVRELAAYMIKRKIKENYYDEEGYESLNYNIKLLERLNDVDENHPISFSSCNYDTYIRKISDCYLVATCNNHSWDLWKFLTNLSENAKNELSNLLNDKPKSDDYRQIVDIIRYGSGSEFSSFGNDFYNLDHQIIGVEIYEDCPNFNDKHSRYGDNMWDTPEHGKICLICNHPNKI